MPTPARPRSAGRRDPGHGARSLTPGSLACGVPASKPRLRGPKGPPTRCRSDRPDPIRSEHTCAGGKGGEIDGGSPHTQGLHLGAGRSRGRDARGRPGRGRDRARGLPSRHGGRTRAWEPRPPHERDGRRPRPHRQDRLGASPGDARLLRAAGRDGTRGRTADRQRGRGSSHRWLDFEHQFAGWREEAYP